MEKALVEINGGAWDGTVFTIDIDPETGDPPPEFVVDPTGQELLTPNGEKVIGYRYGNPTLTPNLDDYFPRECPGA